MKQSKYTLTGAATAVKAPFSAASAWFVTFHTFSAAGQWRSSCSAASPQTVQAEPGRTLLRKQSSLFSGAFDDVILNPTGASETRRTTFLQSQEKGRIYDTEEGRKLTQEEGGGAVYVPHTESIMVVY